MPTIPPLSVVDPATWAAGQKVQTAQSTESAVLSAGGTSSTSQTANRAKDVGQQFEALYLRQMLNEMMPKESEALFGQGTAGMIWRSMMSDALATAMSKAGTIGIAQMVTKPQSAKR